MECKEDSSWGPSDQPSPQSAGQRVHSRHCLVRVSSVGKSLIGVHFRSLETDRALGADTEQTWVCAGSRVTTARRDLGEPKRLL